MHVCVRERGRGERERERLQLSTCQPFPLLSCQPPPAGARYPMVQNREGLGKPLFPLSVLHLHLPASAHHSWVGSVRQTATEPLYDILTALSPIKSRIQLGQRTGSCLTSERHMLEFTRTASAGRFWICGLCAPLSLWGAKVTSPGLARAMITQKQRRQTYTPRSCIISTCHTDARHGVRRGRRVLPCDICAVAPSDMIDNASMISHKVASRTNIHIYTGVEALAHFRNGDTSIRLKHDTPRLEIRLTRRPCLLGDGFWWSVPSWTCPRKCPHFLTVH